jgi:hypothetical protein
MQSHIGTIRDSRYYGKISTWAPDNTNVLTREPMFSKTLPFNNDTSNSGRKVSCH